MQRLQNKTILITGGLQGRDEAEIRLFGAEGVPVRITDIADD